MSPEAFTESLKQALGERLTMVALFGSSATEDVAKEANAMVVCERLGMEELDAISGLTRAWAKGGNPPPLLFALERLMKSSHVFPIELLDIKENHRVLYGRDVLRDLPISQENLCFQLEHELKGKLIQLREGYLLAGRDSEAVLDLMLRSLSHFQVMLKAALRFHEVTVPARKEEAVAKLEKHLGFELSAFEELQAIKAGKQLNPFGGAEVADLFRRYLGAIERCSDLIGSFGRRRG